MHEQFTIDLSGRFSLPETEGDLMEMLGYLFAPAQSALTDFISALQYENKTKFGPSQISNLRFYPVMYEPATVTGRIRVVYDMQLTFGCEDAVKDHLNQHSYYNFKFNPSKSCLHFESDVPEAPSAAEEF
ncbi:hypothetical protein [Mucilaginibacter sp. AK015]|uniref:hypothetical protein n=1 Tax=Mucilaginibacter sp. AK015 TaxID=2723072 RepID=UPI00161F7C2D|nr:hypothetical protein [Mucilaginibacter sp. AK015]MBB5397374.1 hypothetical protein [Mucilaginibacter sp. AK015]